MNDFFRWGKSPTKVPARDHDGYSSMSQPDSRTPSRSWDPQSAPVSRQLSGDHSRGDFQLQTKVPHDVMTFQPNRVPSIDSGNGISGQFFFAPNGNQQPGSNFGGFGGNFYFALSPQVTEGNGFPIRIMPNGSNGGGNGFFPGAIPSNGPPALSNGGGTGYHQNGSNGYMLGPGVSNGGATGSRDRGIESAQGESVLRCQRCLSEMQTVLSECERMFPEVSPEQRAPLVSQAHKRLSTLDREVEYLLGDLQNLPANHPVHRAGLRDQRQQLHQAFQQWVEITAHQFMKKPKENVHEVDHDVSGKLSGQAPTLHSKLEELDTALEHFRMSGSDLHGMACKTADHASASFEHFRTCGLKDSAKPYGTKLLGALRGFSDWADPGKVQNLLQKRQQFLLHRFACGHSFLELEKDAQTWSSAEPMARNWQKVVSDTLGQYGILDWEERARNMYSGSSSSSADSGTLRIRAVRASNLRCTDVWDQPNPYVVFELCGQTLQTEPVLSNEPEPQWKAELRFEVDSLSRSPLLKVHVMDFYFFTADDFLGYVDEGHGGLNLAQVFSSSHSSAMRHTSATFAVQRTQGGSASCQTGRLALRGDKAGNRGASIEFEVHFDAHSEDPLVCQPQQSDRALMLFAQVQQKVNDFLRKFGKESEGFFLQEQDVSANFGPDSQKEASTQNAFRTRLNNMSSAMGSFFHSGNAKASSVEMQLAQEMKKEVWDYNQTLDLLNVMTSDKDHMAVQASSFATGGVSEASMSLQGILAHGGAFDAMSLEEQHAVSKRFADAMEHIRYIERGVATDVHRRRVYAQQDTLLPQIGIWSTDRRRNLREQVFRATIRVHGWRKAADGTWYKQIASAIAFIVVLCSLILYGFFGPGNSWLVAGVGLAVLAVLPCIALGVMYQHGAWKPQKHVKHVAEFVTSLTSARDAQRVTTDQGHPFANGDGRGMYARVMANH